MMFWLMVTVAAAIGAVALATVMFVMFSGVADSRQNCCPAAPGLRL